MLFLQDGLSDFFWGNVSFGAYLVFIFCTLIISIPGFIAIKYGFRLFNKVSVSSVRWVVGIYVVYGVVLASFSLSEWNLTFFLRK